MSANLKGTPVQRHETIGAMLQHRYREYVVQGGGIWVGIQRGEAGMESLVLFNSQKTGSTLALKCGAMSPDAVARKIALHDDKWARMCDGGQQ